MLLLFVAAACGSDDDDDEGASSDTTATAAPAHDPDGILRYAEDLSAVGGIALDPAKSSSVGDYLHLHLVYDTLLRPGKGGTWVPGLATSWEVVDPSTITVELREGVTFSDGAPFDAEAVKFGLERNRDAKSRNLAPQLQSLASVEVTGPLAVTLKLSEPIAGFFLEVLGGRESMVPSPKAAQDPAVDLNKAPIGAGPFTVERFVPEQVLSLRKNAAGWDAAEWKLAGIDFVHTVDGPPRVNALRANQIDMAPFSDVNSVASVEGDSDFQVDSTASDSDFLYIGMCKSQAPFDDVDVRKAMSYAIDREAVNASLLNGEGEPMWGFWPEDSEYFTESVAGMYEHDVEKAKEHLEKAGHGDGLSFDVMFPAGVPVLQRLGEVVQAQYAEAGMKINLVPSQNIVADFYEGKKAPVVISLWIRPGLQKATRMFGPNSVANICSYSNPAFDGLTAEIAALPPDDPEVAELWHEIDELVAEEALVTYVVFRPILHAWDAEKVQGVEQIYPAGQGVNFKTVSIAG